MQSRSCWGNSDAWRVGLSVNHVFSVESDGRKRQFMLDKFDAPKYMIDACEAFVSPNGPRHPATGGPLSRKDLEVDMLILGFVCKTVSIEFGQAHEYPDCIASGEGGHGPEVEGRGVGCH